MTDRQIWFLTGSQGLYGDDVLAPGRGPVARGLRRAWPTTTASSPRSSPSPCSPTRPRCGGTMLDATSDDRVVGRHRVDAHLLPGEDVDRGAGRAAQAAAAPAHPGRPRPALVDHRHGLHEPQPGRPRRPGVRVHPDPDAAAAAHRGRSRVRPGRPPAGRRVVARRHGRRGAAHHAGRPLRRQHARRRGHRGRQGRGRDPARRLGQHLRGQRPGRRRRLGRRRHRRRAGRGVRGHLRRRARAAPRRRAPRVAALRRPHRGRPAPVPRDRRVHGLHLELRGPRRAAPAARPGRPATDGRRLRLRRRGRLEDVGARAHPEGDGAGAARRHVLHGGLHLPPRARQRAGARRAHARGLPDPEHRPGPGRDPPARHRWPRGPGAPGVRRRPGRGRAARDERPRRPVPPGRERGHRGDPRSRTCRSCPSAARSGAPSPTSRPRPRAGCSPAARTTRSCRPP